MKHKNLLYKIEIREIESKKTYLMEIRTPHLNWSMEQYQRNRQKEYPSIADQLDDI